MNVLIIGGTGLLGSQAARELISRGHTVAGLALPPVMAIRRRKCSFRSAAIWK